MACLCWVYDDERSGTVEADAACWYAGTEKAGLDRLPLEIAGLVDRLFTKEEMGSGSLEKESPVCIVAMEKEEKTRFVHQHRLGKRQRHAHKAGQALTQRVIPALHMGRFSRLFSYSCVLLLRDHRLVDPGPRYVQK